MSDLIVEAAGLGAASLTTGSFAIQILKIWKTRDTTAISTGMYVIFSTGVAGWFVYGILINSISVIVANSITFLLSITVIFLKRKYPGHVETADRGRAVS